jgi:hypothetical protein
MYKLSSRDVFFELDVVNWFVNSIDDYDRKNYLSTLRFETAITDFEAYAAKMIIVGTLLYGLSCDNVSIDSVLAELIKWFRGELHTFSFEYDYTSGRKFRLMLRSIRNFCMNILEGNLQRVVERVNDFKAAWEEKLDEIKFFYPGRIELSFRWKLTLLGQSLLYPSRCHCRDWNLGVCSWYVRALSLRKRS